jgi:SAM-dependent methyltransferase
MAEKKEWFTDDSLWEKAQLILFHKGRMGDAAEETDGILALTSPAPGSRILDLCCGIGRISLELARRGFQVTAVDITKKYLEIASRQAGELGLSIELVHDDMRRFRRDGYFDLIINCFSSFGYFEDKADDITVIRNVSASLKKGGGFLLDTVGKETIARTYQRRDWHEGAGYIVLEERNIEKDWSWMRNRWIIISGEKRNEITLSHRLYSATEMIDLVTHNGFSRAAVYGDLSGRPYDENPRRLIVVAGT